MPKPTILHSDNEVKVGSPTAHRKSKLGVEIAITLVAIGFGAWAVVATPFWFEIHGSAARCFTDPRQPSMGNFLRWMAAIFSLFLIVAVRPLAGRLAGRWGISRGGALRAAFAVLLALGVSEIVLRKPWQAPGPPFECAICPPGIGSPIYTWQLKPSATHVWHGPHDTITYYTDAEGNRAAVLDAVRDRNAPTIIVGGESIAMGIGVSYENTFAGILESDLHVQVVNTAVFGYGVDQAFLREQDVFREYAHPIALITTFVPEQVARFDFYARNTLGEGPAGGLEERTSLPEWIRNIKLRSLWREYYHSSQPIADSRALAQATMKLANERGAYALFVTPNYKEPCLDVKGKAPALYRTVLDEQGIPRVNVTLSMDQRVEGDDHPGAVSHRAMAVAIENALRAAHVL